MYVAVVSLYPWDQGATLFLLFMNFSSMAPTIFAEKNFARVFMNVNSYGTIFLGRIRERNWFGLVYDNEVKYTEREMNWCTS